MSNPPANLVGRTGVGLETLSLTGTGTTAGSALMLVHMTFLDLHSQMEQQHQVTTQLLEVLEA